MEKSNGRLKNIRIHPKFWNENQDNALVDEAKTIPMDTFQIPRDKIE